jgi:hypothetical protein
VAGSTIIAEDGSGKINSNSYITASDARTFASLRGFSLPSSDSSVEAMIIKAMDWIETKRDQFKGIKTSSLQACQWPRSYVEIDGIEIANNSIPSLLKSAQAALVIEINNGIDIQPTRTDGFVKRETVGPITTEYSEKVGASLEPVMTAVESFLNPLLNFDKGNFTGLRCVRV